MQVPLQVSFRNIEKSDALDARIRAEANRLERFHPRIERCRVIVEETQARHHVQGRAFAVRIEIRMPARELLAGAEEADVYVAVRDAFTDMRRQLDHIAKERQLS